jgi:hypothetical protein
LAFEPTDTAILFAPESVHDVIVEMWLWEALDAVSGPMPPLIDAHWPLDRQREAILAGNRIVSTTLDANGEPLAETNATLVGGSQEDSSTSVIDDWVDDEELARREQREEWSAWLDELERDDIGPADCCASLQSRRSNEQVEYFGRAFIAWMTSSFPLSK